MYVVVEHSISNPKQFWEIAAAIKLPEGLKIHSTLPNSEGTKAVCLWEGKEVKDVRNAVEGAVGKFSKNEYFSVETKNAMGLPN
jgi:hypothetical protein